LASGIEHENVCTAPPLTSIGHSRDPVGEHRPLTVSDHSVSLDRNTGHEAVERGKVSAEIGDSIDRAESIVEADVCRYQASQSVFARSRIDL
jgi:hypothetical protein